MCVGVPRCPSSQSPLIPTAGKTQLKMLRENPLGAFSSMKKVLLYEILKFQGPPVSHHRSETEFFSAGDALQQSRETFQHEPPRRAPSLFAF